MSRFLFFDFQLETVMKNQRKSTGGATVQASHWLYGLKSQNQEVGVITSEQTNAQRVEDGVTFLSSFNLNKGLPLIHWVYYRFPRLKAAINTFKPDYLYQAGAGFITWPLAYIAQKTGIVFIHRIANDADLDQRLKKRLSYVTASFYKKGLAKANIVLCQNDYQLGLLRKRFPEKTLLKIHNPLDLSTYTSEVQKPEARGYVAWLGIFQAQKNLPALLETVQSLPALNFKIAGNESKHIDAATQQALKQLKECPNVEFVGFLKRSEIQSFLAEALLLLNTSHYEGFSNTFLEAFAAGTPVVTTSSVDPDQIIAKFTVGKIAVDFTHLPGAIQEVINDKNYMELCLQCRRYVEEHHDHKQLAARLVSFLKQHAKPK